MRAAAELARTSHAPRAQAQTAPPIVLEVLASEGQPLHADVRAAFERRLGHDFADVRIRGDARAVASARAIGAAAYTSGRDVVLGGDAARTGASGSLLAHELVHVVQQRRGAPGSEFADSSDTAAEREAAAVAGGSLARIEARVPAGVVQRQPLDSSEPLRVRPQTDLGAVLLGSGTVSGFATNSAAVPSGDDLRRIAGSILGLLRVYPGAGVSVIGHTDAVGEEAANIGLGQRRADAAANALAGAGIPRSAIDTSSAGESSLAVQTPHADPRNRRVEIVFRPRTLASRLTLGTGTLTPPGTATQPTPGPIDFTRIRPTLPPERPTYLNPPPPPRPGTPGFGPLVQQRFNEFVDPIINPIITRFGLPDWMGSALRDAIHSAPGAAGTAALNQAMTQLGVPGDAQAAIRAGVGAAMQTSLDPGETRSEPIRILRPRAGTRPLTEAERFAIEDRAGDKLRELGVRADAERRRRIVRAIREAVEYGDYDHLDIVLGRESVGRVDREEIHIFVSREVERLPVSAP